MTTGIERTWIGKERKRRAGQYSMEDQERREGKERQKRVSGRGEGHRAERSAEQQSR